MGVLAPSHTCFYFLFHSTECVLADSHKSGTFISHFGLTGQFGVFSPPGAGGSGLFPKFDRFFMMASLTLIF